MTSRKSFAQVRDEQRSSDIEEVVMRLQSMGLSEVAEKVRAAMTGECYKRWPYVDETRINLDG